MPGDGELMRLDAIEAEINPLDRLFEVPLGKCMGRLLVQVMPLYESLEDNSSRLFLARPRVLVAARQLKLGCNLTEYKIAFTRNEIARNGISPVKSWLILYLGWRR